MRAESERFKKKVIHSEEKMRHQKNSFRLKSVLRTFLILFILVFAYAFIRYNVIKGVGLQHVPLFIANKAIALFSVVLIALSYLIGPLARFFPGMFSSKLPLRKPFGLLGFGIAAIHGVMSLLLFTPAYYPKFFDSSGQLNMTGELSMLFGVVAFFIFAIVALTSIPSIEKDMDEKNWLRVQRIGYLAFLFVLLHVLVMGIEGWLNPSAWPGGLLPISLVAFIIIAFTFLLRLIVVFSRRRT